jgi:hypothetical protein
MFEVLVEEIDQPSPLDEEPSPASKPHVIDDGCPVEGSAHRCPPVGHHLVSVAIFNVPATDVPMVSTEVVDSTKAQRSRMLGQGVDPRLLPQVPSCRRLRRQAGVRMDVAPQVPEILQPHRAVAHRVEVVVGRVDVALFVGQLRVGRGSGSRTRVAH